MLVRGGRLLRPAGLKISAGMPSMPGGLPETVCPIVYTSSSHVGGRLRKLSKVLCGIRSRVWGLTVEGMLNRVLKCSFHHELIVLFSYIRLGPSADRSRVIKPLGGPYTALMTLKSILLFWVSAYFCTSPTFFSRHSWVMFHGNVWLACLGRCLPDPALI